MIGCRLTAAFLHIQQVVGGEQLAEEDLRLRLASGDVEAQDRRVTPGEGIDIIPLSPEDFQNGLLFPRLPERIGSLHREAHLRDNLLRRVDRYRSVATISSCAALTCTAYGRSPVKQRSSQQNSRRSNCRRAAQGYWPQGVACRDRGLGAVA